MGKAKRYNSYDGNVQAKRLEVQSYGAQRQRLSINSSFRSLPLEPPIATNLSSDSATGTGTYCSASLAADQTTNIAANDHVEFDTLDTDGGITLQTGAGQADGIFELSAGKKYYLSAGLRPEFSGATGSLVVAWYDITNTAEVGKRAIYEPVTQTTDDGNQPKAEVVITPSTNITLELRIISVTALTALANEYCYANIFEIALGGSSASSGGGGGSVSFPITPTINDHGNVGTTTEDLDLSATTGHVHKITLTGNPTLTFSNPPSSGTQIEFEIEFVQDATGGRTVTFPASVAETVTISSAASSTTIVTVRTNDGGTTYHAIPALRGSISLSGGTSFADTALSNLVSPTLSTSINFNSNAPTNFNGYTSQIVGNTLVNDASGASWTLPTGDVYNFKVNGLDQFEITETAINVQSNGITEFVGWTADVGQTLVVSATGTAWTLPTSDTYLWSINGVEEFEVSTNNINVKGSGITEWAGWTASAGQTLVVDSTGAAWTLPNGDTYLYSVNGLEQFEVTETAINVKSNGITEFVGFTAGVGQTLVVDATGMAYTLPTGDTYGWTINGIQEMALAGGIGLALANSLTLSDTSADPATNGEIQRNGNDVKVYTGGSVVNLSNISGTFNDNEFTIQDEIDNTKTLTFNLSLNSTADANLISSATTASRTWTLPDATTTLAGLAVAQTFSANQTIDANLTVNGNATIGDAAGDTHTVNGDISFEDDVTMGSSGTDLVKVAGGIIIKSTSSAEIGFQVTNASISIGTEGTLQIPYETGSASSAAAADADFGDATGCMGVYLSSGGNPLLCIREADGDWATVLMTGGSLT